MQNASARAYSRGEAIATSHTADKSDIKQRVWAQRLAPYRKADNGRAFFELGLTFGLFAAAIAASAALLQISAWLLPFGLIPAAFLLVRLFIIQHDCGHGAMFSSRALNTWVGRMLGVLTWTPYEYWRHSHAVHHAHSGNLDQRGIGDVPMLTVAEYRAKGPLSRLSYRLVRHPAVLFGLGPAFVYLLQQRLPIMYMTKGWRYWASVMFTNLGIFAVAWGLSAFIGWGAYLAIMLPAVTGGATLGIWLFYVQHQFEGTDWARKRDWHHEFYSLQGSSYYALPKPLMWLTGNIGIHHVHHMSSGIPFYRLPDVMRDYPELEQINRMTLLESLKCARLKLWDEPGGTLLTFKEARAYSAVPLA